MTLESPAGPPVFVLLTTEETTCEALNKCLGQSLWQQTEFLPMNLDSQVVYSIVRESEKKIKLVLGSERRGNPFSVHPAWFCHKKTMLISFLGEKSNHAECHLFQKIFKTIMLSLGIGTLHLMPQWSYVHLYFY